MDPWLVVLIAIGLVAFFTVGFQLEWNGVNVAQLLIPLIFFSLVAGSILSMIFIFVLLVIQ